MPTKGKRWRHVVINTHGTWLHGDDRGFRSRKHRIHSSGDYRNPPPVTEHAGLREYARQRFAGEIRIEKQLRPIIGRAILNELHSRDCRIVAIAVGNVHTHIAVELVDNVAQLKRIVGDAKRKSSRAVKGRLPGAVWSAGCTYAPIDSHEKLRWVHDYIIYKQGPGAWTWSCLDKTLEGEFARGSGSRSAIRGGAALCPGV